MTVQKNKHKAELNHTIFLHKQVAVTINSNLVEVSKNSISLKKFYRLYIVLDIMEGTKMFS